MTILDTSFTYGKINLKNRVIFAPTSLSNNKAEQLAWFEKLAKGGCALIIVGDVPVSAKGPMSLFDEANFAYYQQLAQVVHKYGCKLGAQLHQSDSNFKALLPYIPALKAHLISADDLRAKMNEQVGPYITNLSKAEIVEITANFVQAAHMAVKVGFDMIQIHGDRMLGSFSSAIFNKRMDEYGQTPENRARFACDIVKAVRNELPDISIDYKLAIRQEDPHYGNAGVLVEELPVFVPMLEQAGVDSFHVTLANHSKLTDTIPP
ncbi:MAG: NADH:flavin oxidoreductase, partial [Erysipelotrichaceae bacterium]|nr:NADH:flavin oxidoreductase [Erysipelotrichaceae bacterium]